MLQTWRAKGQLPRSGGPQHKSEVEKLIVNYTRDFVEELTYTLMESIKYSFCTLYIVYLCSTTENKFLIAVECRWELLQRVTRIVQIYKDVSSVANVLELKGQPVLVYCIGLVVAIIIIIMVNIVPPQVPGDNIEVQGFTKYSYYTI